MFRKESFHTLKYSQTLYLLLEGDNGDKDKDDNGDNANSVEIDNTTTNTRSALTNVPNWKNNNALIKSWRDVNVDSCRSENLVCSCKNSIMLEQL